MSVHASRLSALDSQVPDHWATGEQADVGARYESEVLHVEPRRDRWFRYGPRKRQAAGVDSGDQLSPLSGNL